MTAAEKLPRWLEEAVGRALRGEGPLDLSRPRHPEIVRALRRIAFCRPREIAKALPRTAEGWPAIPVMFSSDGSEAAPFPVSCLTDACHFPSPGRPLRASMITFRHLDMDGITPLALVRNFETAHLRTEAQEALGYQRAREVLLDPAWDGLDKEDRGLEIFHTGLEPVVVGVYRGVATALRLRRDQGRSALVVWPMIFRGGANPSSGAYQRLAPWWAAPA